MHSYTKRTMDIGCSVADPYLYQMKVGPDREAVFDTSTGTHYSYREVYSRACCLASFMHEDLHLGCGDVVAFCADNGVHYVDMFYASCMIGVVVTCYNGRLNSKDLEGMVEAEKPKALFFHERYRDHVNAFVNDIGFEGVQISIDGTASVCGHRYANIMSRHATLDSHCPQPRFEDIQFLVHTGGTTGTPKASMMSFRAVLFNALSEIVGLGLSRNDSALLFYPFVHTAGWNTMTIPLLLMGGRLIMSESFDAGRALAVIRNERPTIGIAVETVYLKLAEHPDFEKTDFSSCRFLLNGGSTISHATAMIYLNRGIKLFNAYGMTEIGPNNAVPPVMDMTIEELKQKWHHVGMPMFCNELRIIDRDGKDVSSGRPGELCWRGPLTFSGYLDNPTATSETMTDDGWVHSGDIGFLDDVGSLQISGRLKNMIITGGENVFPIEIENELREHPSVRACCVIPVPDSKWGEVGKAIVVLEPGENIEAADLKRFLQKRLPTIKVPRYCTFVEDLPFKGIKVDLPTVKRLYGSATN